MWKPLSNLNDLVDLASVPPGITTIGVDYAALRGHARGEQYYIEEFIGFPQKNKIIIAGDNFHLKPSTPQHAKLERSKIFNQITFHPNIVKGILNKGK